MPVGRGAYTPLLTSYHSSSFISCLLPTAALFPVLGESSPLLSQGLRIAVLPACPAQPPELVAGPSDRWACLRPHAAGATTSSSRERAARSSAGRRASPSLPMTAFNVQTAGVRILPLLSTSLGKSPHVSVPLLPHLYNGVNSSTRIIALLEGVSEMTQDLAQSRAPRTVAMTTSPPAPPTPPPVPQKSDCVCWLTAAT